jgi:tetratricopeptide (TPR) repeat protein
MMSSAYHPDVYLHQSVEYRKLAHYCFTRVSEAYHSLRTAGALGALRDRLSGKDEVAPEDAKLLFARANVAHKKRQWPVAVELFAAAVKADPSHWRAAFLGVHARWLAGDLNAKEAATQLFLMEVPRGRGKAEVLYTAGEIMMRDGNDDIAMGLFSKAVESFPNHVGAKRRLRLQASRSQEGPQTGLANFFRKRDEPGPS